MAEADHLRSKYRSLTGKAADKRWNDATLLANVLAAQDISPAAPDTSQENVPELDGKERNS